MKPLTYSMQFRGSVCEVAPGVLKASLQAPSCAHLTTVGVDGVVGRFLPVPGDEAYCESRVQIDAEGRVAGEGRVSFGRGNALRYRTIAAGRLGTTPDPHLRHGTAMCEVHSGEGQFAGASGRITSNFFLSDTGELTDHHFGVVFLGHQSEGADPWQP